MPWLRISIPGTRLNVKKGQLEDLKEGLTVLTKNGNYERFDSLTLKGLGKREPPKGKAWIRDRDGEYYQVDAAELANASEPEDRHFGAPRM